jgi:hypothetical protein
VFGFLANLNNAGIQVFSGNEIYMIFNFKRGVSVVRNQGVTFPTLNAEVTHKHTRARLR